MGSVLEGDDGDHEAEKEAQYLDVTWQINWCFESFLYLGNDVWLFQ